MIVRIRLTETDSNANGHPRSSISTDLAPEHRRIEFAGFERDLLTTKRPWGGVGGSVVLHCAVGCLAWVVSHYLPVSNDPPLRYRITEAPAVYMQLRSVPLAAPRSRGSNEPAPRPASARASSEPDKTGGGVIARRFELPPQVQRTQADQTLLQPEFGPDVIPNKTVRLPEFMFWSNDMPKVAPPARKRLVVPGRKAPQIEQPSLTAAPELAMPTLEQTTAALAVSASVPDRLAKLTLPAAPRAPLRTFQAPSQKRTPAANINFLEGDPAAVVALNSNPVGADPLAVVPGGNQIGKLPEAPPGPGEGGQVTARLSGSGGGAGSGGRASAGNAGAGAAGQAGGTGDGSGTGNTGAGAADGVGHGGVGTDPALPARAGSGAGSILGTSTTSAGVSVAPIRQKHPDNGVFDVVIADPTPPMDAGGKPLLRGTPVYTVYINVGAEQEWVLRYCVPVAAAQTRAGGNVVQLGKPAPVKPPYPRLTVVPPYASMREHMAVLHGFLTTDGQFRALQAVRAEDTQLLTRVERYLQQWEFRPAMRDGVPIEIEILLLLPRLLI